MRENLKQARKAAGMTQQQVYEQYYRPNRGNVVLWVPVCAGNCLLQDRAYSPFKAACKCFELKE